MRAIPRALIPLAVLAVLLAACDGDEEVTDDAQATFVAVDIDFTDAPSSLPAGEVTVELVNEGNLQHNVTFEGVDDSPVVQAGGGQTDTGTVTLDAGEYVAFCSVPGHREAGMEAPVTVDG